MRVRAQDASDLDKLDDIHASLTRFDATDERVWSLQPVGKVSLRQFGLFSGRNQKFDQQSMSSTPECFS